jgi:hypothetical protein
MKVRKLDKRPSIFKKDKAILSSEMMLHTVCDLKGSVTKQKSLVVSLKGLGAKMN